MDKKTSVVVIFFFLIFYSLNYLTPMAFGDDYVYSFIWQGHSEYEALTDEAVKVSSLHDLLISQWSHYFTWSGRTISHIIAQFFLWMGKDVFNIFNALISILLIIEIYWCANKGVVTFDFKPDRLCWIFFVLWAFTPGFSPVFFWLSGACNYLWTAVFLLGFLLPYIHKYYFFEIKYAENKWFKIAMFILGIIAGWSNENSICWVILALIVFGFIHKTRQGFESWILTGIGGLIIGYAFLMFAPGNVARMNTEVGTAVSWFSTELLKERFLVLYSVFFFQFLLWYFSLRSLYILKEGAMRNQLVKKERMLVQILCLLSLGMTTMMMFSPNFPPRSSFPGTVQLTIAGCILLRVEEEYEIEIIKKNAKKLLCIIGSIYFIISVSATFYGFFDYHTQMQRILNCAKNSEHGKESIITVHSIVPVGETINNASGLHLLFYEMSENEKDWRNVSFSRYYGIKGVRMIKGNNQ